ncbi:YggT family protein [Thermoanaerobacterium sp. DL9XJH110]|uniref:YggT family protein n=1 Tax=Thermoanaerobacterium sp. DL9XJH110 TaxID=3386643 RepID=UPI003BB700FD
MALIRAVELFFQFLYLMIIIRVFLSWFPTAAQSGLARFIYQVTDPILEPFRMLLERFMPRGPGFYIDFSPIVALVVLDIVKRFVISLLLRMIF